MVYTFVPKEAVGEKSSQIEPIRGHGRGSPFATLVELE